MSGQLAMQVGQLIMQGGQLGFCCCPPTACQWYVDWTWNCGLCSDGTYPAKAYTAGTPQKLTDPATFQTPGDVTVDGLSVRRYGANPAVGTEGIPPCGDSPAPGDLDTTTQPSGTPSPSPCQVLWVAHYQKLSIYCDCDAHPELCTWEQLEKTVVIDDTTTYVDPILAPEDTPPSFPQDDGSPIYDSFDGCGSGFVWLFLRKEKVCPP